MSIPLERVALRAMVDNGFQPEPAGAVARELAALPDTPRDGVARPAPAALELDRQRHVEGSRSDRGRRGDWRTAASGCASASPTWTRSCRRARRSTRTRARTRPRSTPASRCIPMLPEQLSTDLHLAQRGRATGSSSSPSSRSANDGTVRRHDVYRALAVNHAKLDVRDRRRVARGARTGARQGRRRRRARGAALAAGSRRRAC